VIRQDHRHLAITPLRSHAPRKAVSASQSYNGVCYPRHNMGKSLSRLLLYVCSCAIAFSQGTTSRVVGTVQDASGAAVPGPNVNTITSEPTALSPTTTSAAASNVFEAAQPGTYELDIEPNGFRKFISRENAVTIGQPATINARLEVVAAAEQVLVEATAETV